MMSYRLYDLDLEKNQALINQEIQNSKWYCEWSSWCI